MVVHSIFTKALTGFADFAVDKQQFFRNDIFRLDWKTGFGRNPPTGLRSKCVTYLL